MINVPLFMIAAYGYVLYRWAISSKGDRVGRKTRPRNASSTPAHEGTQEGSKLDVRAACAVTERF
jgi:hypothetical protein